VDRAETDERVVMLRRLTPAERDADKLREWEQRESSEDGGDAKETAAG
jgi:hypothetical protein